MNTENLPLVSVLLPVHNNEQYVGSAIQSILDQTYSNFELLILVSATTNVESLKVVNSFSDPRIRIINRTIDENLPKALNRGILEAKGEYIARMDADDISLPNRFEKEISFLKDNPDITVVGSWVKTFGSKNMIIRHPAMPEEIKANLLFQTSIVHPTVMMRKEVMKINDLQYNPEYWCSEDIDLWARSVEKVKLANVPEILLHYRTHQSQATRVNGEEIAEIRNKVRLRQLSNLGIIPTARELYVYNMIVEFKNEEHEVFFDEVVQWLKKIAESNRSKNIYNQKILENIIGEKWFIVCYMNASNGGLKNWKRFWKHEPSKWLQMNLRNGVRLFRFFIKSVFN